MRALLISTAIVGLSGLVVVVRRQLIESRVERRAISLQEATESIRVDQELWFGLAALIIVVNLLDLIFL